MFVQLSTAALLSAASGRLLAGTEAPTISSEAGTVRVKGANYLWEYSQAGDIFRLSDSKNRLMVSGKLQPSVLVAPDGNPANRISTPGKAAVPEVEQDRVTVNYEGVNGDGRLSVIWRFDRHGIWTDPVTYESPSGHDVVSFHYFTEFKGSQREPTLHSAYLVVPGISEASTISPIQRDYVHLDQDVWLGRGSPIPGLVQQWALPVDYFCGFNIASPGAARNTFVEGRSDAFTCGLASLPAGDMFLQMYEGQAAPWVDYRSDLWHHLRGPGKLTLGATMLWAVGPDYYAAIAAYYQGLVDAGVIHVKQNSANKTSIALTPEFCTWGAQVDRGKAGDKLDDAFLNDVYRDMKAAGMKAGLFSIDDKWEGAYGNLEHSTTRLPHFEEFLAQLRADGVKVGMWAALMRCERPSDLGLTSDHMLKKPDGQPYMVNESSPTKYYIFDFTQPEVEKVLTGVVRKFIRRYKPDVFKFDFGYEMPAVGVAAPQDKKWAGELLMWKGLEVVIRAMREENPDQVVMYYNLSPLFLDYFDLHSPDDLFLDAGDFDVEANRRLFFSSLMGRLGVPTYGSSGYDWSSSPSIWFDSAALGTVGSLNDFGGDEEGEKSNPEIISKYNGIAKVLRPTNIFEILPIGSVSQAPTLGAHARSWARFEGGQLMLMAYRPPIAGEENLLASSGVDARVKDVIQSTIPVVVSSQTAENITRSNRLAIAPYGSGTVSIRRQQGNAAEIACHYFGGQVTAVKAPILNGRLTLKVEGHSITSQPLEWIEVRIS